MIWLRQQRDPRNKYARWILEFEPINYEIRYRRGHDNGAADYLSRIPGNMDEAVSDEGSFERCVYVLDQELNTLRNDLLKSQLNDQEHRESSQAVARKVRDNVWAISEARRNESGWGRKAFSEESIGRAAEPENMSYRDSTPGNACWNRKDIRVFARSFLLDRYEERRGTLLQSVCSVPRE